MRSGRLSGPAEHTLTLQLFRTLLETDFELTHDPADWIVTEDLLAHLSDTMKMREHFVSRLLTQLDVGMRRQRFGSTVRSVRIGIRKR